MTAATAQHWRMPAGHLVEARWRGLTWSDLRVLLEVGVLKSGVWSSSSPAPDTDHAYVSQGALADRIGVHRTTISRHVCRLGGAGVLTRTRVGSRRGVLAYRPVWAEERRSEGRPVRLLWAAWFESPVYRSLSASAATIFGIIADASGIAAGGWWDTRIGSWRPPAKRGRAPEADETEAAETEEGAAPAAWSGRGQPPLTWLCRAGPSTVRAALRELRQAGLLEVEQRLADDQGAEGIRIRVVPPERAEERAAAPTQGRWLHGLAVRVGQAVARMEAQGLATWEAVLATADPGRAWELAGRLQATVLTEKGRRLPRPRLARAILDLVQRQGIVRPLATEQLEAELVVAEEWTSATRDMQPLLPGIDGWVVNATRWVTSGQVVPAGLTPADVEAAWSRARAALHEALGGGENASAMTSLVVPRLERRGDELVLWLRVSRVVARWWDDYSHVMARHCGCVVGWDPPPDD